MLCHLKIQGFSGGHLLQQVARFFERIASVPLLVVLTLFSALFPAVLFPAHGIGDIKPLDLYFSYSPDQVYQQLAALGTKGRSASVSMALTTDMIFPVVYAMALSVVLVLVLRKLLPPASPLRYLYLFPLLIVLADWCENVSLSMVMHTYPERADTIVIFASTFTSLKWMLIITALLVLLVTVTLWVARVIRDR